MGLETTEGVLVTDVSTAALPPGQSFSAAISSRR